MIDKICCGLAVIKKKYQEVLGPYQSVAKIMCADLERPSTVCERLCCSVKSSSAGNQTIFDILTLYIRSMVLMQEYKIYF